MASAWAFLAWAGDLYIALHRAWEDAVQEHEDAKEARWGGSAAAGEGGERVTATYKLQGITRPYRKGPHPGVRTWKGRPVQGKFRQITIRVDAKRFKMWLAASTAIKYRDLRHWLMYLVDRAAEAYINSS